MAAEAKPQAARVVALEAEVKTTHASFRAAPGQAASPEAEADQATQTATQTLDHPDKKMGTSGKGGQQPGGTSEPCGSERPRPSP